MGNFGDRMKVYENSYRINLPKRMPVILRIDGTHFHTYTRGMSKPFDEDLVNAFWETCTYLAENIMGCKVVYHQSDEISLLLTNYDKLTTQSWFDNNLQKLVSVSASMATAKFNEVMRKKYPDKQLATFDSRAWVIPHDEVCNYFLWRQQDATKNSISMVAQANFSHKELQGLNGKQMQDKLMLEKGVNWNDTPIWQKRGVCVVKKYYDKNGSLRSKWEVDHETPIFSQDREYIEKYVYLKEVKELQI
ncbi:tRNA(His) guanylyltransferase Thg1 family protein [Bacillus sp. AG4(2022)]|uniref:tRNA(His) guanylyltransferase Thg1 family protein n=1 Tax=Bacillus sp. AG4(2022) TaxID=2962594 RepID=UPI0037BE9BFA